MPVFTKSQAFFYDINSDVGINPINIQRFTFRYVNNVNFKKISVTLLHRKLSKFTRT
jgi:hypothetical protein